MKHNIVLLCAFAAVLATTTAATDTNRFILPYVVRDAVFDPVEPRVLVAADDAFGVDVIDLNTRESIRLPLGVSPIAMTISPDAKRLYVGINGITTMGSVAIFDLENLTLLRRVEISTLPHDLVATDTGRVVVYGDSGSAMIIGVFDGLTGAASGTSSALSFPGKNLALHPSQEVVYAVDSSNGYYHHFGLFSAGVIHQWQEPFSSPIEGNQLFMLPDGSRMLSGTGEFLTSSTNEQTDLKLAGNIGASPITSAVFRTNDNVVIAVATGRVIFYDTGTNEPRESRNIPGAQYVGAYGERTAVLLSKGPGFRESEIRFLLPKAESMTENLAPTVILEHYEDQSVFPVGGWPLWVRAEGRDEDGEIESLQLFSGNANVHTTTNAEVFAQIVIQPGTNEIYAVTYDSFGAAATSTVIRVFGNYLPQVRIEPAQTSYPRPQSVTIRANVTDQDGEVGDVTLWIDNEQMGLDQSAPYEFVFTPPAAGTYRFQVRAEDNLGGLGSSQVQTLFFDGAVDHFSREMPLLSGTNLSLTSITYNATREKGEPLHAGVAGGKSVWWAWKIPNHLAANGGILSIDTFGSDFDTALAVYSGGPQGTNDITKLRLLAANDDEISSPPASAVKTFVSGPDVLYIAVDGREGVGGNVRLRLSFSPVPKPANDDFRSAAIAFYTSHYGSSSGATLQPAEPPHAGNSGGASVWWRLQVNVINDPIRISTRGSTFDTLLAIYTTNQPPYLPTVSLTNLVLVAANDDASFDLRSSEITFVPPKLGNYWIAVDGYNGAQGNITMGISRFSGGHVNAGDDFLLASTINGPSFLRTSFNHRATLEPGEPLHAGKTNGASIWHKWTAPTNGIVSISTRGSNFDTILAVYTGTNLTSLTPVVANDDDPANPPTSAVIFRATSGTEYHIALAGYGNARGEFVLALNQTPEYSPRLLTQWLLGKLWLNATNSFGTTVLEGSTNLIDWQVVQSFGIGQSREITPADTRSQQFYRLKLFE